MEEGRFPYKNKMTNHHMNDRPYTPVQFGTPSFTILSRPGNVPVQNWFYVNPVDLMQTFHARCRDRLIVFYGAVLVRSHLWVMCNGGKCQYKQYVIPWSRGWMKITIIITYSEIIGSTFIALHGIFMNNPIDLCHRSRAKHSSEIVLMTIPST